MRRDKFGFFYFVDRLGFSFRWKGENVSATEVASVIMGCVGVVDAVVYGVPVMGAEGRAGMAAVVGEDGFSLQALSTYLSAALPVFARPLFIRLCRSISNTSTFKLKQDDLAKEGLNVSGGSDSLWFIQPGTGCVIPFDSAILSSIASGQVKV
jgi:fatty-acyl-CoA synthase